MIAQRIPFRLNCASGWGNGAARVWLLWPAVKRGMGVAFMASGSLLESHQ
jgi:hypothetical protein